MPSYMDKWLNWLAYRLENRTIVEVVDPMKVSKHSVIKGAKLYGDISIGAGSKIVKGVLLSGNITIGRYTSINGPQTDIIGRIHPVHIGSFCSIARNVAIQEYNHRSDQLSTYYMSQNIFSESTKDDLISKGEIAIGHDVWIGTQSVILSGAKIGNGAIIAANSVVQGEIPPYAIAAGSPAKIIKYRFDETLIQALQQLKWWEWEIEKIKKHKALFSGQITHSRLTELL